MQIFWEPKKKKKKSRGRQKKTKQKAKLKLLMQQKRRSTVTRIPLMCVCVTWFSSRFADRGCVHLYYSHLSAPPPRERRAISEARG